MSGNVNPNGGGAYMFFHLPCPVVASWRALIHSGSGILTCPERRKFLHNFCTNPGQTFRLHNVCTGPQACTEFAHVLLPKVAQESTNSIDNIGFCLLLYGQ